MPNDNEINLSLFPDKIKEHKDSIDFSLFPDKHVKENVSIPPLLPSFSEFDSKKMSTAIVDANTLSYLTGEEVNPSTTYDMYDVINKSIEDDSWGKIFKKSLTTMVVSPLTAVGGLVRAVEERQGFKSEVGKETADYWSKILKEQDIDAAPYSFRKYAGMIIQNTIQNTPTLAVAAATGSQAIPLIMMGFQAAGLKYQQLRELRQSPNVSRTSSAIVGISEAVTETLPLDVLIRPGIPFAKRLLLSASLDVPGELINTAIESALDKVTISPEMTWRDFGVALAETAIVSLGSAGLLTSISHPIVYAREQQEKKLKAIEDKKIEKLNNSIKQTDEELNKAVEEIKTQTEAIKTEAPIETNFINEITKNPKILEDLISNEFIRADYEMALELNKYINDIENGIGLNNDESSIYEKRKTVSGESVTTEKAIALIINKRFIEGRLPKNISDDLVEFGDKVRDMETGELRSILSQEDPRTFHIEALKEKIGYKIDKLVNIWNKKNAQSLTEAEIDTKNVEQIFNSNRELSDDDINKMIAGEDIGVPAEAIKPDTENLINRVQDEVNQHVDMSIMAANKGKMDIAQAEAEKAKANGEALKLEDGEEVDRAVEADLSRLPETKTEIPQAGEGKVSEYYGQVSKNEQLKNYKEQLIKEKEKYSKLRSPDKQFKLRQEMSFTQGRINQLSREILTTESRAGAREEITLYRGSYEDLKPNKQGWTYYSDNPEFANKFADAPSEIASGRVYKQKLNFNKIIDLTKLRAKNTPISQIIEKFREYGFDVGHDDFPSSNDLYMQLNRPSFQNKINKQAINLGYDGIVFNDFHGDIKGKTYVTFEKSQTSHPPSAKGVEGLSEKPAGDFYHYTENEIKGNILKAGSPHEQNYFGDGVYLTEKGQFPGKFEYQVELPKDIKILDLTSDKAYEDFRNKISEEIGIPVYRSGQSLYDDLRYTAAYSKNEVATNIAIRKAVAKFSKKYDAIKAPYFSTTPAENSFELVIKNRDVLKKGQPKEAWEMTKEEQKKEGWIEVWRQDRADFPKGGYTEGSHWGTMEQANAIAKREKDAGRPLGKLHHAYIQVKNPLKTFDGGFWDKPIAEAKTKGNDTVVYFNEGEKVGGLSYIPLNKEQIKIVEGVEGLSKKTSKAKPTPKSVTLDSLGLQTIYEALDGYVKSGKPQEGIDHLTMLGKSVYAEGKTTLQAFTRRMKEHLGKLWDSFKDMIKGVYDSVKAFNEGLGERGAIGRGETAPSKVADLFEADLSKLSEDELRSYLRTSVAAGQKMYREGKREEGDKYKEKVSNFIHRARKLRAIRDSLYLTDVDLQKISKKNPLLLSNYEFHLYLKDVQQKAIELSENKLQKAMLLQRIWEKDLNHVDNYRKVLNLPTIAEMTTEQVKEFADTIEGFEQGDTFLGERALDVIENYTDWAGIATWREAKEKLAKSLNISLEKLEAIDINEFDMTKGDYALSQRHPLLNLYVHEFWTKKVIAMQKYFDFEKKLNELAKKSALSRKRTLTEKLIPQDKQIFNFIEAEDKQAASKDMTPEQIDYAHFIQQTFHDAYEYLIEHKVLGGSRFVSDSLEIDTEKAIDDTYITHMRRGFLEALKDDGLIRAFQEIKDAKKDNIAYVNIIDDTGKILPYEKWFQFAMYRTGEVVPSQNVTAIALSYMKQFYLKQSLDETVVKLSLYARMLTPEGQTKGGLDLDPKLIDFTNKWVNSKKGRKVSIGGFLKQGGYVDTALTGLMTLTRVLDLGFHPIIAPLSIIGENLSTLQNLGMSDYIKGYSRLTTKQGKKIISQYTEMVGKKMWEQLTEPDKLFSDRFNTAAFGFFGLANRKANETHLLGALTDEEFKTGVISPERQAEIKVDINKYRIVEGMQSIIGMTSIARATLQYRSWAVPHLVSVLRNIENINKKTSRDELIRLATISGTVLIIGALTSPDDNDKSLYAQIYRKALREALSLFGSLDPEFWFASPRVITWLQQLSKNIKMIITLEEYKEKKRKGQLKGIEGLKRQFTPAPIRALKTKE